MLNNIISLNRCLFNRVRQQFTIKAFHSARQSTNKMSTLTGDEQNHSERKVDLSAIFENNPKRFQRIKFLGRLFEAAGYELRIAGGAVRDILKGVEPGDIDFATDARPEQSLKILEPYEDLLRIIVTTAGQKHGTVAVKFKETDVDIKKIKFEHPAQESKSRPDKTAVQSKKPEYDEESPFEITTLRCDNITDGRHAEVEFVNDWRIDAERRDLTINAMFLTLGEGKLVDYFNGESDLMKGNVRFVGNADTRIKEDYLRILRFFRFYSKYGRHYTPDKKAKDAIIENLNGLDKISGERLWQELKKTLSQTPCFETVKLMLEIKLFEKLGLYGDIENYDEYVQASLKELRIVEENVHNFQKDILTSKLNDSSTNKVYKKTKELLPVILFTSIVKSSKMCIHAHDRMKFSNVERDSILYIIDNRSIEPELKQLKYDLAMVHKEERTQTLYKMRAYLIYKGKFELSDELDAWNVPNFPIVGSVVAKEVHKRKLPKDKIKVILQSLKEEWANSDYQLIVDQLETSMVAKLEELVNKPES